MSVGAARKAEPALVPAQDALAIEIPCACRAIDPLAPRTTADPRGRARAGRCVKKVRHS